MYRTNKALFARRPWRTRGKTKQQRKTTTCERKKVATNNEDAALFGWRRSSCGCRWPSSCTLGCSSPAEQAGCSSPPLLAAQLYGCCHYWVGGWRASPLHRSHCTCCGSSSAQREQTGGREVALPTTAQAQPGGLVLHHPTLFLEGGCLLTPHPCGSAGMPGAKRRLPRRNGRTSPSSCPSATRPASDVPTLLFACHVPCRVGPFNSNPRSHSLTVGAMSWSERASRTRRSRGCSTTTSSLSKLTGRSALMSTDCTWYSESFTQVMPLLSPAVHAPDSPAPDLCHSNDRTWRMATQCLPHARSQTAR